MLRAYKIASKLINFKTRASYLKKNGKRMWE